MKILITLIALLLTPFFTNAQGGCTDPNAINYDPNAQTNDGSCIYETTYYTPQTVIDPLPSTLNETSGLIYYNGGLWSHNDSGGDAAIYKFDTINGNITQTITIGNGENVDWEDIAQDENYIYVGDIGNNDGNRTDLTIYRLAKSEIPAQGDATLEAGLITYAYSDQDDFTPSHNNNNFDCEAMMIKEELIYLFSKNWVNQKTKLYGFPKIPGNFTAALIDSLDVSGLITAVDYNNQDEEVTLLGYENFAPFIWLLFDYDEQQGFFSGNKRRIELSNIMGTQTEGLSYSFGKSVFISSESTALVDQSLYKLNTSEWTELPPVMIPETEKQSGVRIIPNPADEQFVVRVWGKKDRKLTIRCYTPKGNPVYHKEVNFDPIPLNLEVKINSRNWKKGVYFIKISGDHFFEVKKLVVE
ncbi:MAG: T9SS type A sorting domain-containing protein [Bacteroidales bacterium]|nr:T9SS type A sorting domain-containing protein [Bacteroidales bacterium]